LRIKLKIISAIIFLLCSFALHAENFVISDIRVNGLQRVSYGSLFAALPLNVGDEVNQQDLTDATRELFKTGFFQDIKLLRDDNILIIEVLERPSISKLEISGNKVIKTEDLLKGLAQSGLAEGEIFKRVTLENISTELQRQYVAQGRYSSKITAEVVEQTRNRVELKINIKEGKVAKIAHINIVGNKQFKSDDLLDLFELRVSNWLSFFKGDDKYVREKLAGDLERLRSYYLDRGFINMQITSTQVSITPDKKRIYITVNISEDKKYTISELKLAGDLKVKEEELTKLFAVKVGQEFSQQSLNTTIDRLTRRLGDAGYTFAKINSIPQINSDSSTVALTFMVNPGNKVYVNRINFRGNTKTADEVLRREMRQMEGASASTDLINRSKVRLERLGYFREVNVETPQVVGKNDQIDVNFTVEEQPSGSINASIGYSQNAGMILGGSISQSNFLGTGNRLNLGLNRSEYQENYSFGFVNPYFTDDGVSFGYNAFYRKTNYDKLKVNVSSYSVDSYGGGINFSYPISETSNVSYGLLIQDDKLKVGNYTVDEIMAFMAQNGTHFVNYKLNLGWSDSQLNRGLLPTAGRSQSLSLEVALPGSDLNFYKIDYRGQYFVEVSQNTSLRFHTELGFGDGYDKTKHLPFYEHYYAGGFGSVRGFEDGSLGARSTPSVARDVNGNRLPYGQRGIDGRLTDSPDPLPYGGNALVQGGVEYIFPLPFVKDQRALRTSFFVDIGNSFLTKCPTKTANTQYMNTLECGKVDLSNLASSYGLSLTWVTIMGPLSFSIGRPIYEPVNSDTKFFQFSLGQSF